MDVSQSHCGIRIDKAHPYDTGEWKCHVTEVPGGSTLYSSVDLYVSNHSQVYISEPDMWEDSSQVRISCRQAITIITTFTLRISGTVYRDLRKGGPQVA